MSKKENFEFKPLPAVKNSAVKTPEQEVTNNVPQNQPYETSGLKIEIPYYYSEKLKDYCYWEGDFQAEVVLQALREFIDKREIRSRPEKVKNKKKPGKK